jgi:phytoene synthase
MNSETVWTFDEWESRAAVLAAAIRNSATDAEAMGQASADARSVQKAYSSSFFLVTRFLPPVKCRQVQLIYAAVRYPDELVDTFAPAGRDVKSDLDRWEQDYREALKTAGLRESVARGTNPYIAAFAEVVKIQQIPHGYYLSFLDAMRADLRPSGFDTAEDLISNYVYGSAVVVGYFLTHVYGSVTPGDFTGALDSARDLAIGLQMTNFARDVADDYWRGRIYAPLDVLADLGWDDNRNGMENPGKVLTAARTWLAKEAKSKYKSAAAGLHLFNSDCRAAMGCCIRVYSLLNDRILETPGDYQSRPSLPWLSKFAALPPSKYWRVPMAMAGLV